MRVRTTLSELLRSRLRDMWSELFGTTVRTYRTTTTRPMTPEQQRHIALAFGKVQEAFDELDKAFK